MGVADGARVHVCGVVENPLAEAQWDSRKKQDG